MMYDTVREELQSKITAGVSSPRLESPATVEEPVRTPAPPARRPETRDLVAPKTSPTLVEFQNKKAPLPDWRLELQNAVRQRKGAQPSTIAAAPSVAPSRLAAAAAAPARVHEKPEPPSLSDPRVASAMRRIERSQKQFLKPEPSPRKAKPTPPFGVVASRTGVAAVARSSAPDVRMGPKSVPKLRGETRITNKLPAIDEIADIDHNPSATHEEPAMPVIAKVQKLRDVAPRLEFPETKRIEIKADERSDTVDVPDDENDIEDLAPLSMRFGAGLFDLIIAGFASMIALSPLAFTSTDWWNLSGLLTFLGALAGVAFVYMTLCLGFFGKTMGMRLFSLELVDALENEYPTLRQAAVNSFFFLLSLPFAGAGLITVFFNEEGRAVHDLLSGTIMVKEF